MSEHEEQAIFVAWARRNSFQYPELDMLYAIPNGARMRMSQARKMKEEGLRAGVPDMCLPIARQGYHGLYYEMKFGRNKPSAEQSSFIRRLIVQGYHAVVCYCADEAIEITKKYLEITDGYID